MSTSFGLLRSRVRTQWFALGAALVVLAGVVVAWGLAQASDRVGVVRIAQSVRAGDELRLDDLTIAEVAVDGGVEGLVPSQSIDALVGRTAAIDLSPGQLVQVGMWRDAPALADGEDIVGALLDVGRFPAGLAIGDSAVAAPLGGSAEVIAGGVVGDPVDGVTVDGAQAATVVVRVIDVERVDDGRLSVTLAVDALRSVSVAQLAATDRLVLVGRPAVATP